MKEETKRGRVRETVRGRKRDKDRDRGPSVYLAKEGEVGRFIPLLHQLHQLWAGIVLQFVEVQVKRFLHDSPVSPCRLLLLVYR